jgi:hypothetical protein
MMVFRANAGWPNNPRALAGRLRRPQTFLRAVGIDIAFGREGRAGNRVIRMRATRENTVRTVSSVGEVGSRSAGEQSPPRPSSPSVSTKGFGVMPCPTGQDRGDRRCRPGAFF